MTTDPLIALLISFSSVFLKGFQHKNVIGNHYKLVFFTSYLMAVCDVLLVGVIVAKGWSVAMYCGTGAAFGMIVSMWLHDKLLKRHAKD